MCAFDTRWTQGFDARERRIVPSVVRAFLTKSRNALAGGRGSGAPFGKFNVEVQTLLQKITSTSCSAANCGRRRGSTRKNIIGHGMSRRGEQFLARGVFWSASRALLLPDQPAREQGARIFLDPLIEQGADFLAEIGGMTETRKFVALERIARSREKELPRGLGWGTGHVGLLETDECKVTMQ